MTTTLTKRIERLEARPGAAAEHHPCYDIGGRLDCAIAERTARYAADPEGAAREAAERDAAFMSEVEATQQEGEKVDVLTARLYRAVRWAAVA